MIGLSSNIDTLNHGSGDFLVKSWSLPLGKVNLFWVKDGVIRATISRGDGKSSYISDILGLQKHWTRSSAVLTHVLSDAYAILNQSSNREFFLRIAPRICGGGHGHSKDSSDDRSDSKREIHDRNETDQSSRSETKRAAAPDRQEVSHEKQQSDQSNQGSSEEGAHEQVNPSPAEHTESHWLDLAGEVALHGVAEAFHLGPVAALLHTPELNKGENEWVSKQIVRDLERKGVDLSDLQIGVPDPVERSSQDYKQDVDQRKEPPERSSQDYAQDVDRREEPPEQSWHDYYERDVDRREFDRGEPPERSWHDYYERDMDRRGDISDFRDNMRENAERNG